MTGQHRYDPDPFGALGDPADDDSAGLFAAADPPAPGTVLPTPTVTLDGTAVAGVLTADQLAAAPLPDLILVDRLRLDWGRSDLARQPEPSRLTFSVLDTTPDLRHARRASGWLNAPVVAGWTLPGESATNFRGLVDEPELQARTIRRADGTRRRCALLSFAAVGLDAQLANYRKPPNSPAWGSATVNHTVDGRRGLIAGMLAGLLGVTVYPGWSARGVVPLDPSESDAATLLRDLHTGAAAPPGYALTYDPAANAMAWCPRRNLSASFPFTAALTADGTRGGRIHVHTRALAYSGLPNTPALGIDAGTLIHTAERVTVNPAGGLTRIEVLYDHPNPDFREIRSRDVAGTTTARNTLALTSQLYSTSWVDDQADGWADMAGREMRAWTAGGLRLETRRTGGFETVEHARSLLRAVESPDYWFIQRSILTRLGVRPYFGVIGGVLEYARGHWSVDMIPADVGTAWEPRPLKAKHADRLGTAKLSDLDRTVTCRDLAHVDVGHGYTIGGANPMPTT